MTKILKVLKRLDMAYTRSPGFMMTKILKVLKQLFDENLVSLWFYDDKNS